MVVSHTFKVLVVGPFAAGKTTFIELISDVAVVGTEVATSDDEALVKPMTTAGVEYGVYSVVGDDADITLLLFGTPGQLRFADVRQIASLGSDGLIIMIDASDPESWSLASALHAEFGQPANLPTLLVVNRWSDPVNPPPGLIDAVDLGPEVGITCGNVVNAEDSRRFLIELLTKIVAVDEERSVEQLHSGVGGQV